MTNKIKYQAKDGTIFNTKEDCIEYEKYCFEKQNFKFSISLKEALRITDIKFNEFISIIQEKEIDKPCPVNIFYICKKDIDTYFDVNKIQVVKIYPDFLGNEYDGMSFVIKNHESFKSAYLKKYGR